jgi:ankyrin repeat protein
MRLHHAVLTNDIAGVIRCLATAKNIDAVDENGFNALHLASGLGHVEVVELLLASNCIDVDMPAADGYLAIHFASAKGYDRIVYLLGKAGSKINAKNDDVESPLFLSARFGNNGALNTLLQFSALVNEQSLCGETPLFIAAASGNFLIVNRLLKHKNILIDLTDCHGATPLLVASQNGNDNIVSALLEAGALVNESKNDGATALFMAAQEGHSAVCEKLLIWGAKLHFVNEFNSTALSAAAAGDHLEVVQVLLNSRSACNVDHKEDGGVTAIHLASLEGNVKILQLLIESGGDVFSQRMDGRTALFIAIQHKQLDCVEFLLEYLSQNAGKSYLNSSVAADGSTLLMDCVRYFDVNIAAALLKTGRFQPKDQRNKLTGETPICLAAEKGLVECLDLFIKAFPNNVVNMRRKSGSTALHIACKDGNEKMVRYLLGVEKININARQNDGMTPLMEASRGRCYSLVKLLCESSMEICDVNLVSTIGMTALAYSVLVDDSRSVDALIANGAKLIAKNNGVNALHIACEHGNLVILKQLKAIATVADINQQDRNGNFPLSVAVTRGDVELVKFLIDVFSDTGMDLDQTDADGNGVLSLAAREGREDMIILLFEAGASFITALSWGKSPFLEASIKGHDSLMNKMQLLLADERKKDVMEEQHDVGDLKKRSNPTSGICSFL